MSRPWPRGSPTTKLKKRNHGFYMDDDDSSSGNESFEAFAQGNRYRIHGTRQECMARSTISSNRALSMKFNEYEKVHLYVTHFLACSRG